MDFRGPSAMSSERGRRNAARGRPMAIRMAGRSVLTATAAAAAVLVLVVALVGSGGLPQSTAAPSAAAADGASIPTAATGRPSLGPSPTPRPSPAASPSTGPAALEGNGEPYRSEDLGFAVSGPDKA